VVLVPVEGRFAALVEDLVEGVVDEPEGVVGAGVCCAKALPNDNAPVASIVTAMFDNFGMQPLSHLGEISANR
jgi:hypothetical protein